MELIAKAAKITAPEDLYHWGGVFAENGFYIVLEAAGSVEKPAVSKGREIFDKLLTSFTNYQKRDLETVTKLLNDVKSYTHLKSVIIGLLDQSTLYLGSFGENQVWLKRGDKVGRILSENESVAGNVQEDDLFFLFSPSFQKNLTQEKKQKLFLIKNPEEALEIAASLLFNHVEKFGASALVLLMSLLDQEKSRAKIIDKVHLNRQSLIRGLGTGKKFISKFLLGRSADAEEVKSKKILLTISAVLVCLLIASIFLNINHTRNSKNHLVLEQTITQVTQQYEEGSSLIDLNPVRARELLSGAKLSLSPLLSVFPKNSDEEKKINEWFSKISIAEVAAYKIYKLTAVPVFFDLSLVKQGGEGKQIASFRNMSAILDSKNKVVYSLTTDTKQSAVIAGSETIKEALSLTVHANTVYLVNSDGIVAIDIPTKTAKIVVKRDEAWGEIAALENFGGSLYLLDIKNNAIWKYIATDFGFSAKSNYLNPDVRVNFGSARAIVIDGSVWVAFPTNIMKFSRGLGQPWSFKSFSENLQNITAISTGDNDKNIYLLDKTTNRIIVFEKDGSYQSQYQWDELQNANGLVANEEEKKIYVLMGNKIYAIDIK